jgi:3-oxoacid CoA-transferase subunit A
LVHAWTADRFGNLVFRAAARNFNPVVATAGRVTVVEAEQIAQEPLDPGLVHTPGIYVDRLVQCSGSDKYIEQRTTRQRPAQMAQAQNREVNE